MSFELFPGVMCGHDFPPVIIAECGINHGGDPDTALSMIYAAKHAGRNQVHLAA